MGEQNHEAVEKIDLSRTMRNFGRAFKKTWWLVVLLGVLLGGFQYYRSYRSFRPMYTASASFSVKSGFSSTTDLMDSAQYYNSQATDQVVSAFPYIINSEAMRERIRLATGVSWVGNSVQAISVEDTNLFTLNVTRGDPQEAYDILLAVIDNYPQVASFVIGNTQLFILEEPVVPTSPSNRFSGISTAVKGGVLGVLLGLLLTMALAMTRRTVQSADDLKHATAVPCLGMLPLVAVKRRRKSAAGGVSLLNKRLGDSLSAPVSAVQVRLLRSMPDTGKSRVVLVTSTAPGEGKTTVSFNLAVSLAQSGKRVILVDADLRHQVIKERFGIDTPSAGLLELSRAAKPDVSKVLIPVEDTSLYLLAGDSRMTSPMSVLDTSKMRHILAQTRALADYVIVDAPPAGVLADAAVLCRSADEVVYVVRYDGLSKSQVADGIYNISGKGAEVAGYVINGYPMGRHGYGQYGYGRYGYGKYGYGKRYGYGSRRSQ